MSRDNWWRHLLGQICVGGSVSSNTNTNGNANINLKKYICRQEIFGNMVEADVVLEGGSALHQGMKGVDESEIVQVCVE